MDQKTYNAAYWAWARSVNGQQLFDAMALTGDDARMTAICTLAMNRSYTVDLGTMLYGYDPYVLAKQRVIDGYTWVPAPWQPPVVVSPGLAFPGLPSYDPFNAPKGSIPVADPDGTDQQIYKTFGISVPVPVPPAPPSDVPLVDTSGVVNGNWYLPTAAGQEKIRHGEILVGELHSEGGRQYRLGVSKMLMGNAYYWLKV